MNLDEFSYIWSTQKGNWVLVNTQHGYGIVNKKEQTVLSISNEELYDAVIKKMREEGCKVYDNILDAYADV
ncbi:MAG: hypothetical protein K6E32_07860 [Lachnospiraceae bacterium]|nr:hypothetical protein [Lachnospiraceae bacterium]